MKVKFLNKFLLKQFYEILTYISTITSFLLIFIEIPEKMKLICAFIFLLILLFLYIMLWVSANKLQKIKININNTVLEITEGDIFKSEGFKIIAFNEYFDTCVDDILISRNSLNGQYIINNYSDVSILDNIIENNNHAQDKIIEHTSRSYGKNTKYQLGTIIKDNEYFLLAFSKFDDCNRAYLEMVDYVRCLNNMWCECDIFYAGKSISLPLLGSGITRLKGYENISNQELLEILLWTFKISKLRVNTPEKIKIVLTKELLDSINLFDVKNKFTQ